MGYEMWRRRRQFQLGLSQGGVPLLSSPYDFNAYANSSNWTPQAPWSEPATTGRLNISTVTGPEYTSQGINKKLSCDGGSLVQIKLDDTAGGISVPHRFRSRPRTNLVPGAITSGWHLFFGVQAWGASINGYSAVLNGSTGVIRILKWTSGVASDLGNTTVSAYNNDNNVAMILDYYPNPGNIELSVWTDGDVFNPPATPDLTVTDTSYGVGEAGFGFEASLEAAALFYKLWIETL